MAKGVRNMKYIRKILLRKDGITNKWYIRYKKGITKHNDALWYMYNLEEMIQLTKMVY